MILSIYFDAARAFAIFQVVMIILLIVPSAANANSSVDCVGRLQVSLPGPVEVAAISFDEMSKAISPGTHEMHYKFSDGEASLFGFAGYGGRIFASEALTELQLASLRELFARRAREVTKKFGKIGHEVSDLSIAGADAWRLDQTVFVLVRRDHHAFYATFTDVSKRLSEALKNASQLVLNIESRALNEVPPHEGVCLPFAFVKDDGAPPRNVEMSYRLKEHPDLTISLSDVTARPKADAVRERNARPEAVIDNFWGQYELDLPKPISSVWRIPQKRHVSVAGNEGLASFVTLPRHNGRLDLGYMAAVQGNHLSNVDSPDIVFTVIQDSSSAIKRGIRPVDRETFLEIAENVLRSVRHSQVKGLATTP